jgi:hypothetical protein
LMGSVFDPMPLVLGSRALSSATYTAPSPDLTPPAALSTTDGKTPSVVAATARHAV